MEQEHPRAIAARLTTPIDRLVRLEVLANDAEVAGPGECAQLLLRLRALIAASEPSAGDIVIGRAVIDDARFDALIDAGADMSAALALLPRRAAWMLSSRAEGDLFLATILLPGMIEEVTGQGASAALAMVAGTALAMAGGSMAINDCDSGADSLRL